MSRVSTTHDVAADVLVLGAGLAGAAVACELADRGRRVALVGTSDDSLAPVLGHVLVGPGIPYRTLTERLGRDRARQVWECQRENGDRLRLFVEGLPGGCDYRPAGGFLLSADRDDAMRLADSEDLLRDDGFAGEFLDHYMLEARFDVTGFTAAYWAADDAELDAARLRVALLATAAARGAKMWPGPKLVLALDGGGVVAETAEVRLRAPWAVLTKEGDLPRLAPPLSRHVRSEALPALTVSTRPAAVLPSPARTADGAFAWQATGDRLLLAGRGDLAAMAERLARAPGSDQAGEGRAGVSADGLPVIGLLPESPLAVAVGLGTLAASYAFVACRWIAAALVSGRDPTPAPFRPDRFPPTP